jgi:hypothetical protein
MNPQPKFIADCITSTTERCDNLNNMQASGLITASFFIKDQCWQ